MRPGVLRRLCVCLSLAAPLALAAQPAFQVKDINTTVPMEGPFTGSWVEAGGIAYFAVSDGIHGVELWRSDGTAAGTRLVKDLCPGICSSYPTALTALGDRIFFRKGDANGSAPTAFTELWTSDGTAEGTVPFLSGFIHEPLIAAGPFLFFAQSDPGDTGRELWKTDGTVAGTVLVKDILPGPFGSHVRLLGAIGSTVYFTAYYGSTYQELGKSDGTEAGTVHVANLWPVLAAVSGNRIFLFTSETAMGSELWVSDGSAAGPVLLKTGLRSVFDLTAFDGGLVFTSQSFSDTELWASDGTVAGTLRIQDLESCSCSFRHQRDYLSTGSQVFFSYQSAANGNELWTTDGTEAGTVPVADINPGAADAIDRWGPAFTALGGKLLFFANDGTHGPEVWTSDGTAAGTALVADLEPGANGSSGELGNDVPLRVQRGIVAAGKWLFLARTTSEGWALWKTDGTAAGTELVLPIHTQASSLLVDGYGVERSFGTGLGDLLLFQAEDGLTGVELWKSNGTEAGTARVADLNPSSSHPREFRVIGDKAYFIANLETFDPVFLTLQVPRLWKTDGTEAGTEAVPAAGTYPDHLTPLGDTLFFSGATTGSEEKNLWLTVDGPDGETRPVGSWGPDSLRNHPKELTVFGSSLVFSAEGNELWKVDSPWTDPVPFDIHPAGMHLADANRLTVVGSTLFFVADDGATGFELWKTDGTAAGTTQVLDILPGPSSAIVNTSSFVTARSLLFFVADGPGSGRQLWRSDGTAAGTFHLTNVLLGYDFSTIAELTAAFDRVYFVADDGVHGRELWTSDGTLLGTYMVEDINPGPGSSSPQNLEYLRHTLLFAADDGTHGLEPWVSDGTTATTFLLQDVAPGALPSSAGDFSAAGSKLYFEANDGTHGFEPWALPKTAVGSTFADVTRAHWAWSQVEALATAGVTLGCAAERYCPGGTVTRSEMAIFLGRAIHGGNFVPPPATGTRFQDVPASHWAGAWIEQIATDGVTQGCSANPPLFCIGSSVTRAEMAIFLLRAKYGGNYTPPPATGTRFTDVPASHWAAAWIEQLAAENITQGCAVNTYCPGSLVSRSEMAVFLTRAFELETP